MIHPLPGDFVIAADGGYQAAKELGITPDLLVGDFDSLNYVPDGIPIERHPVMKDDTDTLLAVRLGLSRGYRNFVLIGTIGGRLDHTIANLQTLLFLVEHGAKGILYGDGTAVTTVHCETVHLTGEGIVSVFCFGGPAGGVTETGLKYGLDRATVTSSFPIGVSNEFTDVPAAITAEEGTLLVLWSAEKERLPEIVRKR